MNLTKLSLLFFLFSFISCSSSENSYEVKSRVENGKINRDRLLINELEFNDKNTLILSLTLEKNIDLTSNQISYFLIAQYGGKEQFLIKEKDCIMISVDGENHMFSTAYEPWVDISDLGYLIVVYLDVEKDYLYKIANAKNVKVYFNGEFDSKMGTFSKENFLNFRKFLKQFDK